MKRKNLDIQTIALDLDNEWMESRYEILDSYNQFFEHEIEKEFFEEQCIEMGLSDNETELVLKELGY